jgi:F420-dependent oxidoreductase-like protein
MHDRSPGAAMDQAVVSRMLRSLADRKKERRVRVGIIAPQGWTGEFAGVETASAWQRTATVARQAEDLGFDSVWLFDHFHTTPKPTDELTFESFVSLGALATLTRRVELGQLVSCAGFRNPALVAKMVSTLDAISGGRVTFGVGAGWKEEEWLAYGYQFPSTRDRLRRLEDALEIATRMLRAGRADYAGPTAHVQGAINQPVPIHRPHLPIVVGGNGREVTWRLAARFADELNLDSVPPDEIAGARVVLARHCQERGRDPATLRLSVHIWWEQLEGAPDRARLLARYREAGVDRVMTLVRSSAWDDEALPRFRKDVLAAGGELVPS